MKIETASCSGRGGRACQEDSLRLRYAGEEGSVVVADGLGGHGGGEIASSVVADILTDGFADRLGMDDASLQQLFCQANAAVLARQTPSLKMRSTGTALFFQHTFVRWGHVGDSRLYWFQNGALIVQTLDHSVSQLAVFAGEINQNQIRHHVDRNRVLKAFGMEEGFHAELSPLYRLKPGFHAFLLCTDGFWEYVLETEMEIELAKAQSPDSWLEGMYGRLAGRVPENHDNFSAAAVFLNVGDEELTRD